MKTIYNKLPYKFEAGTPHVAAALDVASATSFAPAAASSLRTNSRAE